MELVGASGRLDAGTLDGLPARVARPGFDRAALGIGIVHLGLGAFARAHLAAVNDAALRLYEYSREEFLSMTIKDIRPAASMVIVKMIEEAMKIEIEVTARIGAANS